MEHGAEIDHAQIINLQNRYALAYDEKDIDALRACYMDDATFRVEVPGSAPRVFEGLSAILANAQQTFQAVNWRRRHVITNHVILRRESHLVKASCYLQLIDTFDDDVRVTLAGQYVDTLALVPDGWRVSQRTLFADGPFRTTRNGPSQE